MLDGKDVQAQFEPTRENILREIQNLVKDAQAGDRFLFHFSGHSQQVVNRSGTEDDGMDEGIICSDSDFLIDNILKQYLVEPLPVGCSLVVRINVFIRRVLSYNFVTVGHIRHLPLRFTS
jgi:hypothetical protein